MSNVRILRFLTLTVLLVAGACSSGTVKNGAKIEADELVFAFDPEPVKGKLDVYDSMARGAKYNVDVASRNLGKKIDEQSAAAAPQKIMDGISALDDNGANRLYKASQVLEFAVIYGVSSLSGSRVFIENNFYEKSSQHLALAAIRAHQNAWFAERKLKELDRLMRQERKNAAALSSRLEKNGSLNAEELEYKKQLDVALLKMEELHNALVFSREEYARLVKTTPDKMNLEGRRFYELEDFDKGYSIDIFQEAAVRNRKEFALAKEQVKSYAAAADLRRDISRRYPLVKRLDINGLDIEDKVYEQELYDKAMRVAYNLLEAIQKYRGAKEGSDEKNALRRKAFDELGAAVLTQAEVGYRLVELADADYQATENAIKETKDEIKILEKKHGLTRNEQIELLNRKIILLNQERLAAQISAERAVALRNLYFDAGLSPLGKQLLKAPVKDVAADLRKAFNGDLTEMLSGVKVTLESRVPVHNGWAQKENWLEELIDENPGVAAPDLKPVSPAAAAKYTVMQLGAYAQKENAEQDWRELSAKFPELKTFRQSIENAENGGAVRFRLIVRGDGGKLAESCNSLRRNGYGCLLR